MKALIIGGGGFVGRYLAEHLVQDCGWETFLTKLPKENVEVEGCEAYNLDILDKDAVEALLSECAGCSAQRSRLCAEDFADWFR